MKSMTTKSRHAGARVGSQIASSIKARIPATMSWRWTTVAMLIFAPVLGVHASVEVDQSPLIVSDPLPPNIVLLHDDSGSMDSNYLPDDAPKGGHPGFRDSSQNRQYYNPQTLYTLPPKADGTDYPASTFPSGFKDPYSSNQTTNILSQSDYSDASYDINPSYNTEEECEDAGGNWDKSYWSGGIFGHWVYECKIYSEAFVYFDNGDKHHVIRDGQSCDGLTNCHKASDSLVINGETTTYGQNVANYFSYYRSRFLSAKSGIMSAFFGLDPAFRFGFGSINNTNSGKLSNDKFSHVFRTGRYSQKISIEHVKPFGDGTTNTQKKYFWDWLEDVGASGSTPSRRALETAGRYYQTEQPWLDTDDSGKEVEYSCRPAYTILVSDGYWSGSAPSKFLNNSDNTSSKTTDNYSAADPFKGGSADGDSATLADVANYYWKTDLRPGITDGQKNQVPATPTDPATWQHMTTFTVGLGLSVSGLGEATQAQLFEWARTGEKPEGLEWGGWPTPGDGGGRGKSENVSDMLHAAINGHGDFFSARNPKQFSDGIKQALAAIDEAPGAGSSPSFSGGETLTSSTRQYTASYTTGSWIGELSSVGYDESTGKFSVDPWRASAQLPAAKDRNIWTTDPSGAAVEFKSDKLGDYLKTLGDNLYLNDKKGADWGDDIVNYLRGDRSYEDRDLTSLDDVFRKRDSLLGDIVTSTPVVIGAPELDLYKHVLDDTYFDGLNDKKSSYESFATDNDERTPIVYVAANDGMLHAFNANTGVEVFAFIPGAVVGGTGDASLARLANPEYGIYSPVDGTQPVPHQYFNDGKLTTQNVYLDGEWKTILVGTTGRGTSRTVYALDITNPADLADPKKTKDAVLWERSAGDGKTNDDWIGMALGRPTISLIKSSTKDKGQWVVHVGNGPNSESNKAALLQFDLATGSLEVYSAGTMKDNGLAAPYVIQANNTDGVSEYAFAGDLKGNVWRFPLSPDGGSVSAPIFIAKDDKGDRQPITADMYATQNGETGAVWVFFGTGRFLTDSDMRQATPQVQTWYGLRALAGGSGKTEVASTHTRADNLQMREIVAENVENSEIYRATSLGDFEDLTKDGDSGWYMDLISPEQGKEGERIVYQTQLIGGRLIVNTLIPKSSSPCDNFPGGATLIVDPFSGANPGEAVLDTNGDDKTDEKDSTTIKDEVYFYNGQRYGVGLAGVVSALIGEGGVVRLFGLGLDSSETTLDTTMGATGAELLNWHEILN